LFIDEAFTPPSTSLFHKSSDKLKRFVLNPVWLYCKLYDKNLSKLLESKKVEFTEVEEADEVRVRALFRANEFEFISLKSLKKVEFSLLYLVVKGEGVWTKLFV
jgi:hypothetical protein